MQSAHRRPKSSAKSALLTECVRIACIEELVVHRTSETGTHHHWPANPRMDPYLRAESGTHLIQGPNVARCDKASRMLLHNQLTPARGKHVRSTTYKGLGSGLPPEVAPLISTSFLMECEKRSLSCAKPMASHENHLQCKQEWRQRRRTDTKPRPVLMQ